MVRRVQADLFQRHGRTREGLRGAFSMESQVMQRYILLNWGYRAGFQRFVAYSQDAKVTSGRGLYSVNFTSVPPRSRMDVQD